MKKHVKIFALIIGISLSSFESRAQDGPQKIDTTEFSVVGVCNMCKARIENAALIKGVKYAEWDKQTSRIAVIYRTDKVSSSDIQQAVAEGGHDTEDIKAKSEDYNKLPECCGYRDGVKTH